MFFVASWAGAVKYHGPQPSIRPKQAHSSIFFIINLAAEQGFVRDHTSMIDFIILEQRLHLL
uniref:Uncharacterized protein n=1 Tax=Salix viminalis TaxID=40686 RepID=A0A6N2LJN6_SALVM